MVSVSGVPEHGDKAMLPRCDATQLYLKIKSDTLATQILILRWSVTAWSLITLDPQACVPWLAIVTTWVFRRI